MQPTLQFRWIMIAVVTHWLSAGCSFSDRNLESNAKSETKTETRGSSVSDSKTNDQISEVMGDGDRMAPSRIDQFLQSVYAGDLDAVRQHLTMHPSDIDACNADARTALMLASFNGHQPIVELLLTLGANVNLADQGGRTALMYASTGNNLEIVRSLLNHSASVNAIDKTESWTPLMFAASEGKVRIVQLLLENGADRNAQDIDGEDCVSFAQSKGHADVVWLLKNFESKK